MVVVVVVVDMAAVAWNEDKKKKKMSRKRNTPGLLIVSLCPAVTVLSSFGIIIGAIHSGGGGWRRSCGLKW